MRTHQTAKRYFVKEYVTGGIYSAVFSLYYCGGEVFYDAKIKINNIEKAHEYRFTSLQDARAYANSIVQFYSDESEEKK